MTIVSSSQARTCTANGHEDSKTEPCPDYLIDRNDHSCRTLISLLVPRGSATLRSASRVPELPRGYNCIDKLR